MNRNIHGYLIGSEIRVDITLGVITRVYASRRFNSYTTEAVFLGDTAMRLLVFLLERGGQDVVPYSDILHEVWDSRGLVSSYKRLNQVIMELREKLVRIGVDDSFILTVRGQGYSLKKLDITLLYSQPA